VITGKIRLRKFSILWAFFADSAHITDGESELVVQTPRSLCTAEVLIGIEKGVPSLEFSKKVGGSLQLNAMCVVLSWFTGSP
jgi:hypothetical protein